SGALAVLDSLAHPVPATVIGPSGQILAAAARGDLDVVITHAPSLERRLLVKPGHVLLACPFVSSRFAIVGPPADPARVAAAPRAADAFRRIAAAAGPFVSRGDSSGTHVKELALWDAAGVRPPAAGGWYLQAGADQATTLHVADARNAYALADPPTLAKLGGQRRRVAVVSAPAASSNIARSSAPALDSRRDKGRDASPEGLSHRLTVRASKTPSNATRRVMAAVPTVEPLRQARRRFRCVPASGPRRR